MLDVLIKNGKIVDGTGSPWFKGEIGISNDEIVKIRHQIDTEAKTVIDAKGEYVAPGFIDIHAHSDQLILKHPEDDAKIMQGVTTALLGQDGLSIAPVDAANVEPVKKRVAGLLGTYVKEWTWRNISEYFQEIEKARPTTNNMMLIPQSNIRAMVVGWDNREATREEIDKMKELIEEAFAQGGCGFSTGLIYPPAMYASREEMVELLKLTGEKGGFFVVHMRNESDLVRDSLKEVIDICQAAECPLHVSHLKVAGKRNWGLSNDILQLIDQTRDEGLDVTFDQYPYIAGSTMLDATIPPWFHEGGANKMLERLKDPKLREELKEAHASSSSKWENFANSCGFEGIIVTSVQSEGNKFAEGKSVAELSEETGKHPSDVIADLLVEEDNAVTMAVFYGDEEDVINIMKHPAACICSDGIVGGKPHPRVYGAFPRVLGKYAREQGVLPIESAVQRMTANSAKRLNLQDRGVLREGLKADITMFNPETIIDTATYKEPNQYPEGISHVLVNGKIVMKDKELTGQRPGKVIRKE